MITVMRGVGHQYNHTKPDKHVVSCDQLLCPSPYEADMNLRKSGLDWFREHHGPGDETRVSKFYPTHQSWKGPVWWFEFPDSAVSDPTGYINLLCQHRNNPDSFHHLRVPMALFGACKHHLGYREDNKKFSLFLSAERETLFREMRGTGNIEFRGFEHRCGESIT